MLLPIRLQFWNCRHCGGLNQNTRTECSHCDMPRLNGEWPQATWFQDRLRMLRVKQLQEGR